MKSVLIYTVLGIVLATVSSIRNVSILLCDCVHAGQYLIFSWDQIALIVVALLFLIRGFVGLLGLTVIPSESYQGENILLDVDPYDVDAGAF